MTRRTNACIINLDAASLLAEDMSRVRSVTVAQIMERAPTRPRPRADVLPKPTQATRKGRDGGRDQMLSEYLSSLGRIALLTADEEKAIAERLQIAEVRCWRLLLSLAEARAVLVDHPMLLEVTPEVRASLEGLRHSALTDTDADALAGALRVIDDDRLVIAEVIAQLKPEPSSVRATRPRAVSDDVRLARREALAVRNSFVRANLRLVVSVARRFHHYRLPLIDLIQEGNLGLIKSVHRFDHKKGFRFSTYAHWWIRQAIERAIMNKGAQVRLPVHIFDARREAAKATRDLHARLGREPTLEELASELRTPIAKLMETMRAVPREPLSLEDPVSDGEERTLAEVISDHEAPSPDERVIQLAEQRWVRGALNLLSPMEVDIMRRRYGIDTDNDETLEEIGRSYRLSRERVRQIQVQGLRKIKQYAELRLNAG